MAQRQGANLLGQIMGMAAHDGAECASTTTELGDARRTVTGAAGALLLVHLLAGARDVRAVLHRVRASATLGKLIADHARNEILARLKAEDVVLELDRTGRRSVE